MGPRVVTEHERAVGCIGNIREQQPDRELEAPAESKLHNVLLLQDVVQTETPECSFEAQVSAVDGRGAVLGEVDLKLMYIRVRRGDTSAQYEYYGQENGDNESSAKKSRREDACSELKGLPSKAIWRCGIYGGGGQLEDFSFMVG